MMSPTTLGITIWHSCHRVTGCRGRRRLYNMKWTHGKSLGKDYLGTYNYLHVELVIGCILPKPHTKVGNVTAEVVRK